LKVRPKKIAVCLGVLFSALHAVDAPVRAAGADLPLDTFRDRLQGGWVGTMAAGEWGQGVEGWPGPLADSDVPTWNPSMVNGGFAQDQLYVQIPFLDAMHAHGVNASWTAFGNAFRDTQFPLWVANAASRTNLQNGVPAPWSGHPSNNPVFSSIDWQIESGFAGAVTPGMPTAATDIAWRGGHVIGWADGVYGGVCYAAMIARAYTATNLDQILQAGREALPVGSPYRQVVEDMTQWYQQDTDKTTWLDTWQKAHDKYNAGFTYSRNNTCWVYLGLLYGQADFERSVRISMQGGDDADCNPSTVGAILGTYLGLSNLPDTYKQSLQRTGHSFDFTDYDFERTITVSEQLARDAVLMRGGAITGAGTASETWHLPADPSKPAPLEISTATAAPTLDAQLVSIGADGKTFHFAAHPADPTGIAGVVWFFGDLSYDPAAPDGSATHTFANSGTYDVLAYVTNTGGNTSWQSLRVTLATAGTLVLDDADATAGSSISVTDGAIARAKASLPKALAVSMLATGATGKFDLTDNSMVIRNMTVAQVQALVQAAFNAGHWDGPTGLTSSTAAAASGLTAIGFASNGVLDKTSFKGVTGLTANDVLVKCTYYGDADLSGHTTLDDFTLFLNGYQNGGTTWVYGDFDYSGSVTLDDFTLFLAGYQGQGAPLIQLEAMIDSVPMSAAERQAMLAALNAVPEPHVTAVVALASLALVPRRRRPRRRGGRIRNVPA
jgi:hypothetical protein